MFELHANITGFTAVLQELIWAWPLAWLALPLPFIAWYTLPRTGDLGGRALRVPDLSRYQDFTSEVGQSRNWWSLFLLGLMWFFLVAASARPQSYGEPLQVPSSGRDLMLGIDISGSMNEPDLYAGNRRATRMAVVKAVARGFIAERQSDRIGLIMFGSNAYVQTPLTFDHDTVCLLYTSPSPRD